VKNFRRDSKSRSAPAETTSAPASHPRIGVQELGLWSAGEAWEIDLRRARLLAGHQLDGKILFFTAHLKYVRSSFVIRANYKSN
jgi:hypothetical protein